MAIKERKQITGTEAQIKGYAGHNGVLAYATDTKHLHVLSGTAGTTTKLANMSDIPAPVDISGKADRTYVNAELAKKANASHTHTIANVTNLQTALDAKASNADLSSLEAEVTKDLQAVNTALAGKANKAHTHTVSQITDMPKVVLSVNDITPDDSGNVKVGALPLGHLFAWPFQTPPDGAIQCNGATYKRALYKDFFAYATSKGWVKTEAEWQVSARANGGYCPYYSDGDGSTTFRTPKFAPFMQVAIASGNVGGYHQAGLPNSEEGFKLGSPAYYGDTTTSGMCTRSEEESVDKWGGLGDGAWRYGRTYKVSLKDGNSIYGRSDTVQPESHEWMICVVVAGQATNLGSVDMADVLTTVAQVQADISQVQNDVDAIPRSKAYVTETWRSGAQWYRRWSDDWLEQGGRLKLEVWTGGNSSYRTFSLPTAFFNATYTTVVTGEGGYGWATLKVVSQTTSSVTVTGTGASADDHVSYVHFYCSGY